jgi:hypothetical protein
MAMSNIELFDEFTAAALAKLYESFPRKIGLDARILAGVDSVNEFGFIVDENGNPSMRFEIARATLEWLSETGYIRCTSTNQLGLNSAVLTPMGLSVLKATPTSIKPGETIGERLVRFAKDGSVALAKETAKSAIAAGVSMGLGAG